MKKLIVGVLLLTLAMPLASAQVWGAKKTASAGIVDAGNKLCPVSGDPVSGKNFVVYQGKRYGLCCSMCEKQFLADPGKYIAQMEAKGKTAASAVAAAPVDPASAEMERDMEQRDF
jgi:YHS domain-containing protein